MPERIRPGVRLQEEVERMEIPDEKDDRYSFLRRGAGGGGGSGAVSDGGLARLVFCPGRERRVSVAGSRAGSGRYGGSDDSGGPEFA